MWSGNPEGLRPAGTVAAPRHTRTAAWGLALHQSLGRCGNARATGLELNQGLRHERTQHRLVGPHIVHACTAQAGWGQLLLLTRDGGFAAARSCQNGRSQQLALLDFARARHRLRCTGRMASKVHCALSGDYAVITDDGRHIWRVGEFAYRAGASCSFWGDYHPRTVPFSIAFIQHREPRLLIHPARSGTARCRWICATGENLTERDGLAFEQPHLSGYFSWAVFCSSPAQQWLLDDGWVWAPVGIPAVWSLPAWLDGNAGIWRRRPLAQAAGAGRGAGTSPACGFG